MHETVCESCGAVLRDDDAFCERCGALAPVPGGAAAPGSPPEKNAALAALYSFIIAGMGQVYNGHTLKGVAIFLGTLVGIVVFVIPGLLIWIFGVYDAYSSAKKMNAGTIPYKATDTSTMIGFVVAIIILVVLAFALEFSL